MKWNTRLKHDEREFLWPGIPRRHLIVCMEDDMIYICIAELKISIHWKG